MDHLYTSQFDNENLTGFEFPDPKLDCETQKQRVTDDELLNSVDNTLQQLENQLMCVEQDSEIMIPNVSYYKM